MILLLCLINPVFNSLFVHNHTLIQIAGDPWGVFGTVIALAFFLLFYQTDFKLPVLRRTDNNIDTYQETKAKSLSNFYAIPVI